MSMNANITVWSNFIQRELGKFTVFEEFCHREYEGEVKKGSKVQITGIPTPTIADYDDELGITVEKMKDFNQFLDIDHYKAFSFMIGKINEAQSVPGLMSAYLMSAKDALAQSRDTAIAKTIGDGTKLTTSSVISTASEALSVVNQAFENLWDNGVHITTPTELVFTPWFYNLFKEYVVQSDTDNSKLIASGILGHYNGAKVKISNNIYNTGTYDNMCLRTKQGIAFVGQINDLKTFVPEKHFGEAMKGLDVFGTKVVRPEQVICMQVKKA